MTLKMKIEDNCYVIQNIFVFDKSDVCSKIFYTPKLLLSLGVLTLYFDAVS